MSHSLAHSSPLRIARYRVSESEELAALVDRSGVPLRMPIRWIVQQRRDAVGSINTLLSDLAGIRELYLWALETEEAPQDLDSYLARGERLSPSLLMSLFRWIRSRTYWKCGSERFRCLDTVSLRLSAIAHFICWAADIHGRGGRTLVPPTELVDYRHRVTATLVTLKRGSSWKRLEPLTKDQDSYLRRLLRPELGRDRRYSWPVRFPASNPFSSAVQLRNWLCYLLMRDLGLRRGEVLKLTLNDIGGKFIKVRRRTSDADPRSPVPSVKSIERALPVTPAIEQALKAYLSPTHPGRRRRGRHPYLITNKDGQPLSLSGFDAIWKKLRKSFPRVGPLSAHVLRHTWAETLALDFTRNLADEERTIAHLRALGGWSSKSNMPYYYARNALATIANEMLSELNQRMHAEAQHDD